MPSPEGRDELGWKLYTISDGPLPPVLDDLRVDRLRNTLRAVKAIQKKEARTPATVQKFIYFLQSEGMTIFAPTRIYRGGRWDFIRSNELDTLTNQDILNQRPSRHPKINQDIYEIDPEYEGVINCPPIFQKKFKEFRTRCNLKNPFLDHEKSQIRQWATDSENYVAFHRNLLEKVRRGDTDTSVDIIENEIQYSSTPKIVSSVNHLYRPFAATAHHLINKYKTIQKSLDRKSSTVRRSKRMFAPRFAVRQHALNPEEVIGEPVLHTGILDLGTLDRHSNEFLLWEDQSLEEKIPVRFDGTFETDIYELSQYSVAVLGFLDETKQGELTLNALAILKSNPLPQRLVEEMRSRADARDEQVQELATALEDIADQVGVREENKINWLLGRVRDANTITTAVEHIDQFLAENPGYEWLINRVFNELGAEWSKMI